MPRPPNASELEERMRAYGGGTARATMSLIDRALSPRAQAHYDASEMGVSDTTPVLRHASTAGIVRLARSLEFTGGDMSLLFTADTNCAAAFLFASAIDGGIAQDAERHGATWAHNLANAHAAAMYHLRSQWWQRSTVCLAHGSTMDEVLERASDATGSYDAHVSRLSSRIQALLERHGPLRKRVRWGYTAGRLPPGYWNRSAEASDAFLGITERIAEERGFAGSMCAARKSFARGSVIGVTRFGPDMDVSGMIRECDVREIHEAVSNPVEFVVAAAALRASVAKNMWTRPVAGGRSELEVFVNRGWMPTNGVHEAAHALVVSTISDLDRTRQRIDWFAATYPTPFVAAMNTNATRLVGHVAHLLHRGLFLAPASRASLRGYAETTDPLKGIERPPEHKDAIAEQPRGSPPEAYRPPDMEPVFESSDSDDEVDDSFVEGTVESAPPIWLRDPDESVAARGGAVCFQLDRNASPMRWKRFANQHVGNVFVTEVFQYLGYRGFGRSAFLVQVYGPLGEVYDRDVVAIVSYDRSRLDARVAAAMDCLENVPPTQTRRSVPHFVPYDYRGFRLSQAVTEIASDHVGPFPGVAADEPPSSMRVVRHESVGDEFVYVTRDHSIRVPREGWGRSSAHERSVVREFWADCVGSMCPHDMRMRVVRTSTHVVFDDGAGRTASRRYAFSPRTIRDMWDGRIAIAEEREDGVVYVIDNDLTNCRFRLVVFAGYVSTCPELPLSTMRMIESAWAQRRQTCPHAPARIAADMFACGGDPLVPEVDVSTDTAPRWLQVEADRALQNL